MPKSFFGYYLSYCIGISIPMQIPSLCKHHWSSLPQQSYNIHSRTSLICSPFSWLLYTEASILLGSIGSCALASCYISLPGCYVQKIQWHNIDVSLFVSSVNANCPMSSLKTSRFAELVMRCRIIAIAEFRSSMVADIITAHEVESRKKVDGSTRGCPACTFANLAQFHFDIKSSAKTEKRLQVLEKKPLPKVWQKHQMKTTSFI